MKISEIPLLRGDFYFRVATGKKETIGSLFCEAH
jgi:hypothetical protein